MVRIINVLGIKSPTDRIGINMSTFELTLDAKGLTSFDRLLPYPIESFADFADLIIPLQENGMDEKGNPIYSCKLTSEDMDNFIPLSRLKKLAVLDHE